MPQRAPQRASASFTHVTERSSSCSLSRTRRDARISLGSERLARQLAPPIPVKRTSQEDAARNGQFCQSAPLHFRNVKIHIRDHFTSWSHVPRSRNIREKAWIMDDTVRRFLADQDALRRHADALRTVQDQVAPAVNALRSLTQTPAMLQIIEDARRRQEMVRAALGPMEDIRRLGLFDQTALAAAQRLSGFSQPIPSSGNRGSSTPVQTVRRLTRALCDSANTRRHGG